MLRYRVPILVVLSFTALFLAAKKPAPEAPLLRYRFEPGSTQTYRLRKIIDTTTIGTPSPVNPIHIEPDFSLTLRTVEMKPAGGAVVEIVIATWTEPGSQNKSGMISPRYRCAISPLGAVIDLALVDKNDPAATLTMTGTTTSFEWAKGVIQEALLYLFPLWPEKPAPDGKSWEAGRIELVSAFGTIAYRQTAQIVEQAKDRTVLAIHIESPTTTVNSTVMRNKSVSTIEEFKDHPIGTQGWEPVNFSSSMSTAGEGKTIFSPADERVILVDLQETQIVIPDLTALLAEVDTPEARQAIKEKKAHQVIKTHVTLEWIVPTAKVN